MLSLPTAFPAAAIPAEVIDALNRLWQTIILTLGVKGTIILVVAIVVASAIYKRYNDIRKDRDIDLALKEKEKSIQRLAEEIRMWRALFLKDKYGMSDAEVRQLVTKNEFPDAATLRKALEGESKPKKPSKGQKERSR